MKSRFYWLILALLALVQFMVILDHSVANVALPAIQKSLGFEASALQWIITAYTLTFGGMLLLGGRAADLFGRRRVLLIGMIGFTATSFLIGLAASPIQLIILRALQGMMAALMSPSALSIVLTTFKEGHARNTALGVWTAVAAGGAAAGLVIGGILTEYLNWRWNFFINVPVGIMATLGILYIVPKQPSTLSHRHLDIRGATLITAGLMLLVYTLTEAPSWGWTSSATLFTLLASGALIGGFIWNEARVPHPLMPLSIFKIRNVSGANMIVMPLIASMMGMFFLLSLYVQLVMKYPPVETGLIFLPFPLILALVSNIVPRFVPKFGFKPLLVAGIISITLGLIWLSQLTLDSTYLTSILPAIVLLSAGMGTSLVTATIAATSGVPANEAGLASGLLNTSQQMGGALGLAVLSGIAAATTTASMHLGHAAATLQGDKTAFAAASVFTIIALVLAGTVIRSKRRTA